MSTEYEALDCPLPPGSSVVVVPPEGSEEFETLVARAAIALRDVTDGGYLSQSNETLARAALRALTGGDDRG